MWTYDPTNLNTTTSTGRSNVVRLLVGDTNTADQQTQDEEITFALLERSDNVYFAASWVANVIASKYSRRVDTEVSGQIKASYSQLQSHYKKLSISLYAQAMRLAGTSLGVKAGGIDIVTINTVREDALRPTAQFRMDRFRNGSTFDERYSEE